MNHPKPVRKGGFIEDYTHFFELRKFRVRHSWQSQMWLPVLTPYRSHRC